MNESKNNGRGIFYGVIGVATLVVAIIGATFAYFTATAGDNNTITGNMASINFGLEVTKVTTVDETSGGMIPMSNSMVEAAVNQAGKVCVDNNGNAVCQVYRVDVDNTGTASLFLDGYISLTGGSGVPKDVVESNWQNLTTENAALRTTMRWAQVFCTESDNVASSCTTIGKTSTGAGAAVSPEAVTTSGITENWATLAAADVAAEGSTTTYSHNVANIKTAKADVIAKGSISGNNYDIINRNYIRISDHVADTTYDRDRDITSALVFNQYLDAATGTNHTQTYYFVVWLSETGTNQTAGSDGDGAFANNDGLQFFSGGVTFNSAQGSEVTATFSGYVSVRSDNVTD